jgi:site-specific DNA-methyltransferase (adenine-specific)
MTNEPYYTDESVTIYNCDVRNAPIKANSVDTVVGSPPYNVNVDYDVHDDAVAWSLYRSWVYDWAQDIATLLVPTGRSWINVAPVVQQPDAEPGPHSGRTGKARFALAAEWAFQLAHAGLEPCDMIAWTSLRGSGSAWGSWASPASPNLRGDYEVVLLSYKDQWPRPVPEGMEGYRDPDAGAEGGDGTMWTKLVSNVWDDIGTSNRTDHPASYPMELARRCIRLSTWPDQVVLDPWCGSGTTLKAARDLGRRAIGCDISERYCEIAATRASQAVLL